MRSSLRRLACALLAATAIGPPALAQSLSIPAWALRLPAEKAVNYRGSLNLDGAGHGPSPMMYPAPSAVGLLAAIITHGVLVESGKNSQKRAMREQADQVLTPYLPALADFTHAELMLAAVPLTTGQASKRLIGTAESAGTEYIVVSVPVYSVTQDHRALVLDNAIQIHRPGESAKPFYEQVVRVVSFPREEEEPSAYWSGTQGLALKQESARLLAHSLDLALWDAVAPARQEEAVFRTVRYREGSSLKIERAQPLEQPCARMVMRTLRGGLISVPASEASAPGCTPALPDWK